MVVVVLALLAALVPASALAAYSSATETTVTATVPEAVELSGLVASPTHPGWYWAHSDVWKPTDSFRACTGLSGPSLASCQQVQRARLWALRLDPVTHKVVESRSFAVSDPAWALDPTVAQNNDWEDLSLGPPREGGRVGLLIGAVGNAANNPVRDSAGRDVTCSTRRLIELREPDLSDPAVRTWTPQLVFDLANPVGLGGLLSCNFESLVVGADGAGTPTAYVVSRAQRKLFTRALTLGSGRAPGTPVAPPGSGASYEQQVTYAGVVRGATGMQLTGVDANGTSVALLARPTATAPCRILTWKTSAAGIAAALTGTNPVVNAVTCTGTAESLAYVRGTDDLVAVSDSASSRFTSWYFPSS
jgi:hypothetical protein